MKNQTSQERLIAQNELPQLPKGWAVERFRYVFRESKERNGQEPVGSMLSVSEFRGVVPKEYEHEEQKRTHEELQTYRVVRPNQLAVNTMWLNHLGLGVSKHIGHVSPAYSVYSISSKIEPDYAHHLLRSNYYLNIYNRYLYGIRPNSYQIKTDDWASIPIILPPLPTQRTIADFLDRETARIDQLIQKKQRLVELTKQRRFSEISQKLTLGLDTNRTLQKPWGDWLPDFPSNWQQTRIKDVCLKIIDCKNRTPPTVEKSNYFVVRTSCIKDGSFSANEGYYTDQHSYHIWTQRGAPERGDVLITREAPIGEACIAPKNIQFCLGQRMMLYRPNPELILSDYIVFTIYSSIGKNYILSRGKGSTVGHLRVPEIYNFPCLLPPLDEQKEIVDHLNASRSFYSKIESKTNQSISRLREFRSALITAAVTGQIDVDEWSRRGGTDAKLDAIAQEMEARTG